MGKEEHGQVTVLNRVVMGYLVERENFSKGLKEEKVSYTGTQGKSIRDRRNSWNKGPMLEVSLVWLKKSRGTGMDEIEGAERTNVGKEVEGSGRTHRLLLGCNFSLSKIGANDQ